MKHVEFKPEGVCSYKIDFDLDGDIIHNLTFQGGCEGNLNGIARLSEGQKVKDVIRRCKGIDCQHRGNSCANQLAIALEQAMQADG